MSHYDRQAEDPLLAAFGILASAVGGGGDVGNVFPASDAVDLAAGARFIPGAVTLERRAGRRAIFHQTCTPCCWYWELADGRRIYHSDPFVYDQIGRHNHGPNWSREDDELAGPCPTCGNVHTSGDTVAPE